MKGIAGTFTLTKDHYQELSTFLEGQSQGIIPRDVWIDRFTCFWDDNPAFKEGIDQRGWVIVDDKGHIGGFFGSIPVLYYYKGEERIFCIATSWHVDESCRKHSLDVFRRFLKQDKAQLCTTPSPKVAFIFKKMGFKAFEAEWLKKGYLLPINSWEFAFFLRHKLFKNKISLAVSACLMPLLSMMTDVYKFLYHFRGVGEKKGQYFVREIDTLGEEYDAFWEKLRLKFDLLAVRNQKTLNWYFWGTPQLKSQRKILEIRTKQGLIGYVALKEVVRQVQAHSIRYYEMVDAALLEDNSGLFLELLEGIKSLAYKNRISFIKIYHLFPDLESMMREKGFIAMAKEHRFLFRDLPDPLAGLKSWLTPLDGDRGFF